VPNLIKISQKVAEIGCCNGSKNGGRPPSRICEIRIFLTAEAVKKPILHRSTKFRKDRSNRCGDIAFFCDFQDGGCRHLEFSKIRNFNGLSAVEGQ